MSARCFCFTECVVDRCGIPFILDDFEIHHKRSVLKVSGNRAEVRITTPAELSELGEIHDVAIARQQFSALPAREYTLEGDERRSMDYVES